MPSKMQMLLLFLRFSNSICLKIGFDCCSTQRTHSRPEGRTDGPSEQSVYFCLCERVFCHSDAPIPRGWQSRFCGHVLPKVVKRRLGRWEAEVGVEGNLRLLIVPRGSQTYGWTDRQIIKQPYVWFIVIV